MAEIFTFNEGRILVWTGTATASALLAFVENANAYGMYGWSPRQSLDGVYDNHLTGKAINGTVSYLYGANGTFQKMVESATAIHLQFDQVNVPNGSAGLLVWSAVVESFGLVASRMNPYTYSFNFRGHNWSGYGA